MFYYYIKSKKDIIEPSAISTSTLPLSVTPIKNYIETCLNDVGERGVNNIAQHGGYIYPSGHLEYDEPGDNSDDYYYFDNTKLPYVLSGSDKKLRPKKILKRYSQIMLQ